MGTCTILTHGWHEGTLVAVSSIPGSSDIKLAAVQIYLTDLMAVRCVPRLRCLPAHLTQSKMPYVGPPQLVSGCPQSMQVLFRFTIIYTRTKAREGQKN